MKLEVYKLDKILLLTLLLLTITYANTDYSLDEMTVTAGKQKVNAKDAVVTVDVISREDIDMSGASTMLEVITSVPYIQHQPHNGEDYLQFQGLEGEYVVILFNDVPVTGDILSGQFPIDNIDLNQVERVEITKGPNSTLYGSSAMAGTINIITKKDHGEKKNAGTFSAEYGTNNLVNGRGYLYHRFDRMSINATGAVFLDDGFIEEMTQGVVHYDKFILPSRKNYSGSAGLNFARTSLANYSLNLMHNSKFEEASNINNPSIRIESEDKTNNLSFSYHENGNAIKLSGYMVYKSYLHIEDAQRVTTNNEAYTTDYRFDDVEIEQRLITDLGGLELTAGINVLYETTQNDDLEKSDYNRSNGALFAQLGFERERITLEGGGRVLYNSEFGLNGAGHAGVKWSVFEPLTMRFAYGRGYKTPSFKDQYYYWIHPSPRFLVVGNPELTPEISHSTHLQFSYKPESIFFAEGSGYYHNIKDKIGYTDPFTPESEGVAKAINIDEVWRSGAEASLGINIGAFKTKLGYAYTTGEDIEAGETLSSFLVIPHSFTYNVSYYAPLDISIRINGKVNTKRQYPEASTYKGEVLNMLNGAVRKEWMQNSLATTIGLRNILNSKTTEFNQQEGFNVYLRAQFSF